MRSLTLLDESTDAVTFFAPGNPATKGSARAFAFHRGNGTLGASVVNDNPRGKAWAAVVAHAAADAMAGRAPLDGPVRLEITFLLPRPKSHRRKNGQLKPSAPTFVATKPDGDKLERCAWDALTGIVFTDDSRIVAWAGSKLYADDDRVGAKFRIEMLP